MNNETYDCGGDGGGSSGGGGGDGIRGLGRPAFLTKIFNIVSDPNTNSIISWNVLGNSFIIWDYLQFSVQIIPKHFNHNNFSSVVCQLNSYGFRKIGVEHRWEYEHPYFQAGKECLLASIKRRNQDPDYVPRKRSTQTKPYNHHGTNNKAANEINNTRPDELLLRNEINESKLEIQKLKRQQEEMEFHITVFESDVKHIEKNTERLIMCWAKACDQILARKIRNDTGKVNIDDDDGGAGKRRKKEKIVILIEDDEKNDGIKDCDGENNNQGEEDGEIQIIEDNEKDKTNQGPKDYDGENNHNQEDTIPLSEIQTVSSADESGIIQVNQDKEINQDNESGDNTCWKRILLEDDQIFAMKMREETNGSYPGLKDYDGENNQDEEETQMKDNEKVEGNPGVKDYDGENNPVSEIIQSGDSESGPIKDCEDYMYWSNILMDDTDEGCDNESRIEMENRGAKIALDFEVVIAKPDDNEK